MCRRPGRRVGGEWGERWKMGVISLYVHLKNEGKDRRGEVAIPFEEI